MAESKEVLRDKDKDALMEVRGIIDGVIESGSKDYISALDNIADIIKNNEGGKA